MDSATYPLGIILVSYRERGGVGGEHGQRNGRKKKKKWEGREMVRRITKGDEIIGFSYLVL